MHQMILLILNLFKTPHCKWCLSNLQFICRPNRYFSDCSDRTRCRIVCFARDWSNWKIKLNK